MQSSIKNIAFAGSGNVAWHLAKALKLNDFNIAKIWSRDPSNAAALAGICDAKVSNDISGLREGADLIVIAVADKAIANITHSIGNFDGVVVHTAGSVSVDVLKAAFENHGVFYPLQTLSKGNPADFGEVPFFLEASSNETFLTLKHVALRLSSKVYEADSHQRMLLHIAAVFAGNYSNLMYIIGNELLHNANLPPDILHPLMLETTSKAVNGDPKEAQTGPARRHDTVTLEKHISALAALPEYAELYRLLSSMISNKYK
jgi:predicted short-subunit dehydrogenase-like oxidoreductase (DUF2520 family)